MPRKDKMFFHQHASWNGVRRGLWIYTTISVFELWIAVAFQKFSLVSDTVADAIRAIVWVLVIVFAGTIALKTCIGKKRKVLKSERSLARFYRAKSHEEFSNALATLDKRLKEGNPGLDQVWILLHKAAHALFDDVDMEIMRKELKFHSPVYDLEYNANYDDQVVYNIEAKGTIRKPMGALRLYYPNAKDYSRGLPTISTREVKLVLWELK